MLDFFGMLSAPVKPLVEKKEEPKPKRVTVQKNKTPWVDRRRKVYEKYRALMEGTVLSTGEIAGAMGYTHMGCLTSLYKMEKRGVIKRVGSRPRDHAYGGRGQITWTWVGEENVSA